MWRNLAIAVTAAVSLGVAAMPTGVMAAHGGGGHGGGGGGGGRSFSGGGGFSGGLRGGGFSRGAPGGAFVNRGASQAFVNPGMTTGNRAVTSAPLEGRRVSGNHQWAMIGGQRHHGRHIHGFIPGIGYGWYWYYDDCYALTDYGWINICGYDY